MNVRLTLEHRSTLKWCAIYADRHGMKISPSDVQTRGIEALAALIQYKTSWWKAPRGRPRGQRRMDGVSRPFPSSAASTFYWVAIQAGLTTPQQGLRWLLDRIYEAAPGISMDTDFELTLKQIEQVVHEINALGEGDIDAYPEDEEDDFDDGTDLDIGDGNGEDQDDKLQG